MIAFSITCATGMAVLFVAAAFFFPSLYNTSESVRSLATYLMLIASVTMPFNAFANASYFTLRSGGSVAVTFIFDSGYMWGVVIPVSLVLSYLTGLNIFILFPLCQSTEILKSLFGGILLKKINWAKKLS